MEAPFYKLGAFSDDTSLLAAFLIGGAFGFFLERAGFGSSRKLASQFYFRDMSVLKVMFTAIVTAMVGLTLLSQTGFVDLSLVTLKETRLLANLVGGLVLGVGFVVGGYCPGTSLIGAATGRIDAMLYVLGLFAGMFVVGFAWPAIQPLAESASMGKVTLPAFLHVPYGLLVLAVCLMAAGMFVAAEWGEMKATGSDRASRPLLGGRGLTSARVVVGGLIALGALAAVLGDPYRGPTATVRADELARLVGGQADQVQPADLADRIIAGDNTYQLVDLRDAQAYAAYRIPGAESIPLAQLDPARLDRSETWIVYAEDGVAGGQAWVLLKAHGFTVYSLRGGLAAWRDEVLNPVLPAQADAASAKRQQVAQHFGGTPRGAAPVAAPV
ncbi:MAG: YeeE/YedE family protein, partial [Planctomycetes bacterium]|nr:YeeE/YedE family protein [Planctomycetota bacterium]